MPVDTVSFWLKPFGFFDRNPSLDVPPQPGHGGTAGPAVPAGTDGAACRRGHRARHGRARAELPLRPGPRPSVELGDCATLVAV